jgi:hypothetical protein
MSEIEKYRQGELSLEVVTSKEINGVEMGVFRNGTAFLTERGLAKASGVDRKAIANQAKNYASYRCGEGIAPKIAKILERQGFEGGELFARIEHKGQLVNAYPDVVCVAVLAYYSSEAGKACTQEAKDSFLILASQGLRKYIYDQTGYDPQRQILESWKHYHDRLLLNPMPSGYFSVFAETAQLVLASINEGLIVDSHTVPDVSVGQIWSKFWVSQELKALHGERTRHPHLYPDYFPQAQANGDIQAYIYPLKALGEFREWLQKVYLPQKFPTYLKGKAKNGVISASQMQALLKAVEPRALPPSVA